ncbi:MAG TPA: response regulator [Chloroflexia bacterium]|nr:response regulator [Chloroflexia bacterium]
MSSPPIEILVVEDSPTQALRLEQMLVKHGYGVRVARDGPQALAALAAQPPTLVLTDIHMPAMDGYALCRQIKDDHRFRQVPVILLTSLTDSEWLAKSRMAGADNFITKPYDDKCLLSRIHFTLARAALRPGVSQL